MLRCALSEVAEMAGDLGSVNLSAADDEPSYDTLQHRCAIINVATGAHDCFGRYRCWFRRVVFTRGPG
jgi:hypothetical protein